MFQWSFYFWFLLYIFIFSMIVNYCHRESLNTWIYIYISKITSIRKSRNLFQLRNYHYKITIIISSFRKIKTRDKIERDRLTLFSFGCFCTAVFMRTIAGASYNHRNTVVGLPASKGYKRLSVVEHSFHSAQLVAY